MCSPITEWVCNVSHADGDCVIISSQKEASGDMLSLQQVFKHSFWAGEGKNEWMRWVGQWTNDHTYFLFVSNNRSYLTIFYGFPQLKGLSHIFFSLGNQSKFYFFVLIFFLFASPTQSYFVVTPCGFLSHHVITPCGYSVITFPVILSQTPREPLPLLLSSWQPPLPVFWLHYEPPTPELTCPVYLHISVC